MFEILIEVAVFIALLALWSLVLPKLGVPT
jgi:hypothetical protein